MDVSAIAPDVPDCALPIAAVLDAKKKLSQGVWKFDFIYFTEADQILFARNLFPLYRWMDMNPHGVVLPAYAFMVHTAFGLILIFC